jgi:hypothetical protein
VRYIYLWLGKKCHELYSENFSVPLSALSKALLQGNLADLLYPDGVIFQHALVKINVETYLGVGQCNMNKMSSK